MYDMLPKRPLTTDPIVMTDATGGLNRKNELVLQARVLLAIQNDASNEVEKKRRRGVELKIPKSLPLTDTLAPPVQLQNAAAVLITLA